MKKILPFLFAGIFALIVSACEEQYTATPPAEPYVPPVDTTDNGGGNTGGGNNGGGNTGGGNNGGGNNGGGGNTDTTFNNQSCDFFNYVAGDTLTYTLSAGNPDTYQAYFIEEVELNGKMWLKGNTSQEPQNYGYYRCDGTFGYMYSPNNGEAITLRPVKINGTVNESWEDVMTLNGLETHYVHTIKNVNEVVEIQGTTYTDVMIIEVRPFAIFEGQEFPVGENYDEYYSKSTGLILSTLTGQELVSRK